MIGVSMSDECHEIGCNDDAMIILTNDQRTLIFGSIDFLRIICIQYQ